MRIKRRLWRYDGMGLVEDGYNDVLTVGMDGTLEPLGLGGAAVLSQPRWSADGSTIAYLEQFSDDANPSPCPALMVWTRSEGRPRRLLDHDWGLIDTTAWSPDGQAVVILGARFAPAGSVYTPPGRVWLISTPGAVERELTAWLPGGTGSRLEADLGMSWSAAAGNLRFVDDHTVAFTAEHRGRTSVASVDIVSGEPGRHQLASTVASYALLDLISCGAGEVEALVAETALDIRPRLIRTYLTAQAGRPAGDLRSSSSSRRRHLEITVGDGSTVDTWLVLPGPADQGPYPTVLKIHGGPYASIGETWGGDVERLVDHGIAVALHNFRGSYGYAKDSADRITDDWGVSGEVDHHGVLDHLVALGITDPTRIGVFGHSHGGFATCWLVGRSDRFAAAISENPITNFHDTLYAADVGPWLYTKEFATRLGTPPESLLRRSPIVYAHSCTTPTLLIQGDLDVRCLPNQTEQMYSALWEAGCPVEMLRLPASSHMTSYTGSFGYREARLTATVDWFGQHLLPAGSARVPGLASPSDPSPPG